MIGMREKSIRSRLSAVGIVLSLVLGMLVPCFEPLTAFAVSNGNWDDGVNYMEEPITEAHGFNLANNIDNVSFKIGEVTYSSDGTGAVTVEAGSSDPVSVAVDMEYNYTREQMLEAGILTNGGYVYYQMNANIKIETPIFGVGRFVTDDSWSTTEPAGYYSISKDGLITIRYTQAYLNHLKTSKAPEDPETRKGVSVIFTVYGVKNNTRTTLNLPVKALTEANNYTYKLPDRVDDTDGNSFALSYFDNYEIAETLTAHQEEVLGDRFAVSTTRKIRDGTGTLEITNTGKYTVTTGKLQVEKA